MNTELKAVQTTIPMEMFEEMKGIIDHYNDNRQEGDTKINVSNFVRCALMHLLHNHRLHNNVTEVLHQSMILDDGLDRVIILNTSELRNIIQEYMKSVLHTV